jgi:uncharacterized damage-inducible protein DinB
MKKCLAVLALMALAAPAAAQQPPAAAQPPAPTDVATHLKNQHNTIKRNLSGAAEKMAEADYGFKPQGVAAEVRSYGQFIVHLINANNSYCSRAKGEAAKPAMDEKGTFAKADLVKALNDALAYCDSAYGAMTAANATEMMSVQGRGGTVQIARINPLISNLGHNWEHYGNLVTYLRAKGLVPPSSER